MGVRIVTPLSQLHAQAPITKWSTELRRKAIARDIYVNLKSETIVYKGQQLSIPAGIYTKISGQVQSGANNIRVVLKMPINANILRGRTPAMGREVPPVIKVGSLYRGNYRFVVQSEPGYGEDKEDAKPFQLYQRHVDDLGPHAASEEGLEIRQGLLETRGWNLWAGSTAAVCPPQWSRNFFVLGCPMNQQPAFHPVYATYTNRIVRSMNIASGNTGTFPQTAAQMLTGNALDTVVRWAFRRRMSPLTIESRSAYVLTVSQLGAQRFSDPTFTDSLGNRWVAQGRIVNEKVQNWYGLQGKYVSAAGATVYIVVDDRLPTILPTGTAEPFGLQAGYIWPTDDDRRNLDNELVRDAMILHGAGAIFNFEPQKMLMIHQDWDYMLRNGAGYTGVRGIQQLQFDLSPNDPTGAAREYFGSAILVGGRAEP